MELAERLAGSLICCDSIQFYKGFTIGAAGPSVEDMARVPHRLFYFLGIDDEFDAASFRTLALSEMNDVWARGRLPIIVGGTGLYIRALIGRQWNQDLPHEPDVRAALREVSDNELRDELRERDPKRFSEIHPNDRFRLERAVELCRILDGPVSDLAADGDEVDPRAYIIQLVPERAQLHERIARRTRSMLAGGLVSEVQSLLAQTADAGGCKPLQSIGYKQVCQFLAGKISEANLSDRINAASRQYAKRQCTWFKKMPYNQKLVSSPSDYDDFADFLRRKILSCTSTTD